MGQVIALANQKGGVAKTTTTLNLGVALAERGKRVLAIDLDPQSNLTMSQGIDPEELERSMFDVLVHKTPIEEIIVHREVDLAVSSIDLAGAELAHVVDDRPRAGAAEGAPAGALGLRLHPRSTRRRRSACSRSTRSRRPTA